MPGLIDLHAHSTASDGSLTPARLVDRARANGLAALALTDHDTVAGIPEALDRGRETGLEIVPGVEISAQFSPGTMHILGYDLDFKNKSLQETLHKLQYARRERNERIVQALEDLHKPVTMAEVAQKAGGGVVGRPHFAMAMLEKGYVSDMDEAFEKFLGKGKPAYRDKFRLEPEDAVRMVLAAGGLPVLAHPYSLQLQGAALAEKLSCLAQAGLVGLEVFYPEHDEAMTERFNNLAGRYGLAPTGGTDFHGQGKEDIELGRGRGNMALPYELLAALRKKRKDAT